MIVQASIQFLSRSSGLMWLEDEKENYSRPYRFDFSEMNPALENRKTRIRRALQNLPDDSEAAFKLCAASRCS